MAKKNEEPELTRRGVLQVFGATPALAALSAGTVAGAQDEHAHMHHTAAATQRGHTSARPSMSTNGTRCACSVI